MFGGILNSFNRESGLKIHLDKSALLGINQSEMELDSLAAEFGCRKKSWPIKYLGVPLGGNPTKAVFWEPVLSKMKKKLASWKKAFLLRGGRLMLIEAVLSIYVKGAMRT